MNRRTFIRRALLGLAGATLAAKIRLAPHEPVAPEHLAWDRATGPDHSVSWVIPEYDPARAYTVGDLVRHNRLYGQTQEILICVRSSPNARWSATVAKAYMDNAEWQQIQEHEKLAREMAARGSYYRGSTINIA